MNPKTITVIGGGIAGLSSALYLSQLGYQVTLIEKNTCGAAASRVAAGMLAPINELEFTETDMLSIGIQSRKMYAQWEALLGNIGVERTGTLEVAANADDVPYLLRLFDFQQKQGLDVQLLKGDEIHSLEPAIASHINTAIYAPLDIQVDNRLLCQKIKEFLLNSGVVIAENEEFVQWQQSPQGLTIQTLHRTLQTDALLLCTGAYQSQLAQANVLPSIVPVKGEMLMLNTSPDFELKHVVRIRNRVLGNGYIVPKKQGIVVGASAEYQGFNTGFKMGNIMDILRRAWHVVPGLYELDIAEMYTGFRPAAENHRPLTDKIPDMPVFYLNGLYRHGILLGPWAGNEIATRMHQYLNPSSS